MMSWCFPLSQLSLSFLRKWMKKLTQSRLTKDLLESVSHFSSFPPCGKGHYSLEHEGFPHVFLSQWFPLSTTHIESSLVLILFTHSTLIQLRPLISFSLQSFSCFFHSSIQPSIHQNYSRRQAMREREIHLQGFPLCRWLSSHKNACLFIVSPLFSAYNSPVLSLFPSFFPNPLSFFVNSMIHCYYFWRSSTLSLFLYWWSCGVPYPLSQILPILVPWFFPFNSFVTHPLPPRFLPACFLTCSFLSPSFSQEVSHP